jgi:hypothetical protein
MSSLAELAYRSTSLLCLGVPEGTEVGLDLFTAVAGPLFLGFKLIPPGAHLLVSAPRVGALRSSLWFHAPPGGVVRVARWQSTEERLVLLPLGCGGDGEALAAAGAAAAVAPLDARLGAYPLERAGEWLRLTSRVTPGLLEAAGCGEAGAAAHGARGGRGVAAAPAPAPPGAPAAGAPSPLPPPLRLLQLPGVGAGSAGHDRTAHAFDSSGALRGAAEAAGGAAALDARLLGELQLTFVLTLVGQSHEALAQWKLLADALLRAEDALVGARCVAGGGRCGGLSPAGWAAALCDVLPPQLDAAGELFVEEGGGGFLRAALRALAAAAARAPEAPDAPLARAAPRAGAARLLRRAAACARAAGTPACALAEALEAGAAAAECPAPAAPPPLPPGAAGGERGFPSVEALLAALREEAGEGEDLPAVVCFDS